MDTSKIQRWKCLLQKLRDERVKHGRPQTSDIRFKPSDKHSGLSVQRHTPQMSTYREQKKTKTKTVTSNLGLVNH